MMIGLGLSLCSARAPAAASYDPAVDSLTGWWRTDYAGTPWVGTASAGTSGANLTDGTGNPPTTGAAVNGRIPADFDGVAKRIASAIGVSTLMPAGGAGAAVYFNARTLAADQALFYNAPALISSTAAARFALTITASGIRAGIYNGVDFSAVTPYVAVATGGWHWAFVWWDATTLYVQLDGGTPQSVTIGGTGATPDTFLFRVGCNYLAAAFFDGRIADIQTRGSAWAAGDKTNRLTYSAGRYGGP